MRAAREAVFWGADPEFFAPQAVEKTSDVFFYGYGDKFRREWVAAMVGEPSRALPDVDFALGGRDFKGDTGNARMLGDVPFNVFPRAISQARVNLCITRRSHASVYASSSCRPFELASSGAAIVSNPYNGIERWFEPGSELLVVNDAAEATDALRGLLDDPAQAEAMGRRARERVLDEHTYRHRATAAPLADRRERARVKKIAIVPAYNEQAAIGSVVDELKAFDPELDVLVVDDASHDATALRAREHGALVVTLPFNLGIGGAVQTGFRYAAEQGYDLAARVDGDGQHDPVELAPLMNAVVADEADICVGSRFAGSDGYRSSRDTADRHPHPGRHGLDADEAARDRHDERLPGAEPQRDPPVRRRLPARLPRGRGGADAAQAPAAALRAARADARARRGPVVDPRLPDRLLHGEGDARDPDRRAAAARHAAGGRMILAGQTPLRISLAAVAASLLLLLVVFELIRSRRLRERYALLWLLTGLVLLVLSAWRGGLNTIAGWFGVQTYPPAVLFAVALLFVLAVLLHYSTVISKVSDQNVILAQRLALLELELSERERAAGAAEEPEAPAS